MIERLALTSSVGLLSPMSATHRVGWRKPIHSLPSLLVVSLSISFVFLDVANGQEGTVLTKDDFGTAYAGQGQPW